MKFFFSLFLLIASHTFTSAQILREDAVDSSKHAVYIFKTRSRGMVVSPNLIISSKDYKSFWIISREDLVKNYNGFHAVAGVFIDVKPEVEILNFKELLKRFNLDLDISKYRIQVNNDTPVKKRNLFACLESIKSITVDKTQGIVHITSVTP